MWNATRRPDYGAGIELLTQEYLAALAELKDNRNLTAIEQLRLRFALTKEYRGRRIQEREAIDAQLHADHEVTQRHTNGRAQLHNN